MDLSPIQNSRVNADDLPLDRLAASKQVSQQDKIEAVSHAFEAVLLRQILSECQKPVFKSKYVDNSSTQGIYRDMAVEQMANSIAKSNTFGLAASLSSGLQRQSGAGKDRQAPRPGNGDSEIQHHE
jgi:Rod binding domain-containing protein